MMYNECPRCHNSYWADTTNNDLCSPCEEYLDWEESEREKTLLEEDDARWREDNLQHDSTDIECSQYDSRDIWDRLEDYE